MATITGKEKQMIEAVRDENTDSFNTIDEFVSNVWKKLEVDSKGETDYEKYPHSNNAKKDLKELLEMWATYAEITRIQDKLIDIELGL